MRERHRNPCLPVFIFLTVLLLGLFMLTGSQAFADERLKGRGKNAEWQKQKEYEKEYQERRDKMRREQAREDSKHSSVMRYSRGYNNPPDYHKHPGYRERPYDEHRQYGYHDYKVHRYNYRGHWRSWAEWDRYARKHPEIYKHGGYYRENAHLMFRFCDPVTGSRFFFSIGK